nr:DUF2530 domain-containing protein [Frankia sp. Cas4]
MSVTPPAGRRELEPLPYDGVASVTVGTILWLVALVVLLPFWNSLRADGHLWWIATAALGATLGLLGIAVTSRRRNHLRRRTEAGSTSRQAADAT